jgi:diguanylate cyclase (GGDEF)-like protein
VALLRPLEFPAGPPWLRLVLTVALGLGVTGSAMLSSLRGRGQAEQLAFYAFLTLSVDALGQVIAPLGWPGWPLMTLLLAGVAVAEKLPLALGVAALAALLAIGDAAHSSFAIWKPALAATLGYAALVVAVNRALLGEKRRLSRTVDELARLKYGIGQLDDEIEGRREPENRAPGAGAGKKTMDSVTAPLRLVSDEVRRSRRVDRAEELGETLSRLVHLARAASGSHSVLHFEVDRSREVAFLRAFSGPESVVADASVPLSSDPFAFVLDRTASFYATDFKKLLWSLPWYRGEVKVGSLLAVPIRTGGAVAGILVADRLEVQAFTGAEPQILEGFADLAADTLVRARAFQSREDLAVELGAVYPVSRSLVMQKEVASVRKLLLRSAREVVSCEGAALVQTKEGHTGYRIENTEGWAREFEGRDVAINERTWTAWVLNSAEEFQVLDDVTGQRERMPILVLDEGSGRAESLLAVPLRSGDRNLGALMLMGKRGDFSTAQGRVLQLLANQAAASLSTILMSERNKLLAVKDGLTGLSNRRSFTEELARSVKRQDRQGGSFALVLLDIDHFKKLNDTFGHPAGDEALRKVAATLTSVMREGDVAARYGGEEFAVILPGSDETGAMNLAERLREAIPKNPFIHEGTQLKITASLGVAVWPAAGKTPEAILSAADRALYAAKGAGRNRVVAASSLAPPEALPPG